MEERNSTERTKTWRRSKYIGKTTSLRNYCQLPGKISARSTPKNLPPRNITL
jgi:hypothetical protein